MDTKTRLERLKVAWKRVFGTEPKIERIEHPETGDEEGEAFSVDGILLWKELKPVTMTVESITGDCDDRQYEKWVVETPTYYPGTRWEPPETDYQEVDTRLSFWGAVELAMKEMARDAIHCAIEGEEMYESYLEDQMLGAKL
jgi:hypothetical protein